MNSNELASWIKYECEYAIDHGSEETLLGFFKKHYNVITQYDPINIKEYLEWGNEIDQLEYEKGKLEEQVAELRDLVTDLECHTFDETAESEQEIERLRERVTELEQKVKTIDLREGD